MADERCPNCGGELPSELGQHATAPMTGRANCPHCGAEVNVPKEAGPSTGESVGTGEVAQASSSGLGREEERFAGSDTMEGVREEIEDKPGGGQVT
jgi:hypothetical protein